MSRHQAYRNYDYNNDLDEFDGGVESEEEKELSPEDRELMNNGTEEVKRMLADAASKVTVAQIQEALWHYYYDADKTVAYLIKTFIDPQPQPAKAPKAKKEAPPTGKRCVDLEEEEEKKPLSPSPLSSLSLILPPSPSACSASPFYFFPKSSSRNKKVEEKLHIHQRSPQTVFLYGQERSSSACPRAAFLETRLHARLSKAQPRPSLAAFFDDMPWLNVPKERQTIFLAPPRPKGGLLGGASAAPKMSRLQALAAQRRKKAEEAKKPKESAPPAAENNRPLSSTVMEVDTAAPARTLDLAIPSPQQDQKSGSPEVSDTGMSSPVKRKAPETFATQPERKERGPELFPSRASQQVSRTDDIGGRMIPGSPPPESAGQPDASEATLLMAGASPFARALLGPKRQKAAEESSTEYFSVPSHARAPLSVFEAFAKPSPDDIVLEAQAKAWKQTATAGAAKKKGGNDASATKGDASSVTSGVSALKIADEPLPRSKNLNVLKEYERSKKKKNVSFVVVGHVDAGKSTMMGRLLLDLKMVDKHTIDKYRKEAETMGKSSFALAWVLDQGTDERVHGVTIDIATRHFDTETATFTLMDAPGHRDFIPNMIAGASQADFAVLVVDAATGAFESGLKGQTREHALLLRSMGVSRIIVAVNKLDMVGWSQARFDEITQQVSGFLSATGFQLKNVSFVPVSGLHGDNLVRRTEEAAAAWYRGDTLIQELDKSEPLPRALDKPLRLPISEAFKTAASAVTVSGRIEAGSLQTGDALVVQPAGQKAYVKSVQRDGGIHGELVDWAVAGQSVVVGLSGIDPEHVRAGDMICSAAHAAVCIDTFSMKALAFDVLFPMPIEVHRGRLNEAAVIEELTAVLNKSTGAVTKKKPKLVKPGMVARIRVKLKTKVPLEPGQRVVLRTGGETIAAGLLE